ncbi:alginate O-acetyltransferase complex protein AlgI [Pseudobutyrivibrio sp. ACV-2]|uniref:MBOAT family O-acyltransferase n=1 Tax=Pseudobutyrivibrio sp. ACV-2 TaxID=1520801 RepID=UPI0008942278|nr:MBOAT family O-acyltransferase [Pseudobutyrivibrio sp. ACV-2]SEA22785.1 alginate O-acetyltransferase complex protein AlgI [Pseudobutyrivibrio sp. ACV-2]
MTLSDLNFIFRGMPLFLIIYYIVPAKVKPWALLLASMIFYALNDYLLLGVLVVFTFLNYFLAKLNLKEKKSAFIIAVILNAILLIGFKVGGRLDKHILLPLGLSFYVFKMISYQVDIYKKKIQEISFVNMAVYFSMFPQIISGPISRYDFVTANKFWTPPQNQIGKKERLFSILSEIDNGLKLFAIGLFMKVIIADHLAVLWADIKTIGYESISTPMAWIGAYTYSMNLYFDFWGYSLMAAGVGIMLGFPFIDNFIQPYSAVSVSDFYRRWHATLGSWFKDYIYIPLGGSKKGNARTILNLFVVWVVTGLWHGMTLNFIIWAMAIFEIIVFEKFLISKKQMALKIIGRINVLVLIPCTWVVFAIHSTRKIGTYFLRLFPFVDNGIAVNRNDVQLFIPQYLPYLILGVFFALPMVQSFYKKYKDNIFVTLIIFVMFWISVFSLANSSGNPFMYLRF